MGDTSGRSSLWTVAWRVVEAHPVLGVGNDNFILVEDRYINQPGAVQALYVVEHARRWPTIRTSRCSPTSAFRAC